MPLARPNHCTNRSNGPSTRRSPYTRSARPEAGERAWAVRERATVGETVVIGT